MRHLHCTNRAYVTNILLVILLGSRIKRSAIRLKLSPISDNIVTMDLTFDFGACIDQLKKNGCMFNTDNTFARNKTESEQYAARTNGIAYFTRIAIELLARETKATRKINFDYRLVSFSVYEKLELKLLLARGIGFVYASTDSRSNCSELPNQFWSWSKKLDGKNLIKMSRRPFSTPYRVITPQMFLNFPSIPFVRN